MAINKTDIIKEYGAYYKAGSANEKRLKRLLLFGRETTKLATEIKTDDTLYQLGQSKISSLVQSFQKGFTPKGDLTFTPNEIRLFHFKVDLEIYPDDISDSWLGFLESNSLTRKEWPLVRYIMESHFYQQIDDDMERLVYYKGVYVAPTTGTAGVTSGAMNGLKIQLQSPKVNHVALAPLEASTIYDQVELFYESISEEYQGQKLIFGMSPSWRRKFLKDKRALGYYEKKGPDEIDDGIDFTPSSVIGLPSMIGTDDIWATPVGNFLHITKKGENASKANIEESKRCLAIMTDWYEGLGFGLNETVWTNVAAVAPAPAE